MMDTLGYREGAFTCSWATLAATHLAFIYALIVKSEAPLNLIAGLGVCMAAAGVLVGMWISLQFRWILLQHPTVALVFERALVVGTLPLASVIHTLALSLFMETSDVPYYLAISLCVLYYLLGRPLASSIGGAGGPGAGGGAAPVAIGGGRGRSQDSARSLTSGAIQSRLDGFLLFALVISLPSILYIGVHWTLIFAGRHLALHLYSLLLLASLPLLMATASPIGLWWTVPSYPPRPGSHASRLLHGVRAVSVTLGLAGALVGFEGRVVFHAFRQYINLHPPWDWVAVSVALVGLFAAFMAHQGGIFGQEVDVAVSGTVMLVCTTAGSLAAGVPFAWLPAPMLVSQPPQTSGPSL